VREKLRVLLADDERPARSVLRALLESFDDVTVVGEARDGVEAIAVIETVRPDLALLDFEMPEVGGLDVVRLLRKDRLPMIAFVTAYDAYAVRAFEVNAVDYLLKPVDPARLRETIRRAHDRLENSDARTESSLGVHAAVDSLVAQSAGLLRRIPVRKRSDIVLVPVEEVAAIVADGELLHLTTASGEKHTITYRLKDLEARLDPELFVRLSRGIVVNVTMIRKVAPLTGGTYVFTLTTGQALEASRLQSRVLRQRLLKL
jgi:two-component system LytT family response regulator